MDAKKCDKCGEFYEEYKNYLAVSDENYVNFYITLTPLSGKGNYIGGSKPTDLCKKCVKEIILITINEL